jgi:hypothetical protein
MAMLSFDSPKVHEPTEEPKTVLFDATSTTALGGASYTGSSKKVEQTVDMEMESTCPYGYNGTDCTTPIM